MKLRVHELAKKLGLGNQELLDKLKRAGMAVKTHSSTVDEAEAMMVLNAADPRPSTVAAARPRTLVVRAHPVKAPPPSDFSGSMTLFLGVDRNRLLASGVTLDALADLLNTLVEKLEATGALDLDCICALRPERRDDVLSRLQSSSTSVENIPVPESMRSGSATPMDLVAVLIDVLHLDRAARRRFIDAFAGELRWVAGDNTIWLHEVVAVQPADRAQVLHLLDENVVKWPEPPPTRTSSTSGTELASRIILVDASNLCWRAVDVGVPPAAVLEAGRTALTQAGASLRNLDLLFDASFFGGRFGKAPPRISRGSTSPGSRISEDDWRALQRGLEERRWRIAPAATKADDQIMGRLHSNPTALVVSGDMFVKERRAGTAPRDILDRRLTVDVGPHDVRLGFPRNWERPPNIVVHYQLDDPR